MYGGPCAVGASATATPRKRRRAMARLIGALLFSFQARGNARSPPSLRAAGAWAVVARWRAQGMHSPARAAGQAVPRWRAACVAVGFGVMLAPPASFGRCRSDLPGFAKNRVGTRPALPIPPASAQPPPLWGDLVAGEGGGYPQARRVRPRRIRSKYRDRGTPPSV